MSTIGGFVRGLIGKVWSTQQPTPTLPRMQISLSHKAVVLLMAESIEPDETLERILIRCVELLKTLQRMYDEGNPVFVCDDDGDFIPVDFQGLLRQHNLASEPDNDNDDKPLRFRVIQGGRVE